MSEIHLDEQILICCDFPDGPAMVAAPGMTLIGGIFAITRRNSYLSLTHIPSGYAVAKRVTVHSAQRAAELFQEQPIAWAELTAESLRDLPKEVRAACRAIRQEAER